MVGDSARRPPGARPLEVLLALVFASLLVTAAGGRIEVSLAKAHMQVGGWERPLVLFLLLVALRELALEGRLHIPRLPEWPGTESGASARSVARGVKLALALPVLAFMVSPLLLPREARWPEGFARTGGFALAAAVLASYLWMHRRGFVFARERGGLVLGRLDLLLVLCLPLYGLYIGNGLFLSSGDNLGTRLIGPAIVQHGTLDIGDSPRFREEPLHYSAIRVGRRVLSAFPLGTGLLAVPHMAAAFAVTKGAVTGEFIDRLEKHFSALTAVAAALFLFLAVRSRLPDPAALAATAVFALGTTVFSCVSQGMFTTTGEVFFLCLALFLLVPPEPSVLRSAGAGLALGGAFLCRPTALIAAAFVILTLSRCRRRAAFVIGAVTAFFVSLSALWLHSLYGHPLGGYGLMNSGRGMWGHSVLAGLAGNLFSPSRGLLIHCPYLLFVPLGFASVRRDRDLASWWYAALGVVLAVLGLVSTYDKWWGGHSLGPRLMTETTPFLALLVAPLFARWKELGRTRLAFTAAGLFAVLTQLFSTYGPAVGQWNERVMVDEHPSALWSVRGSQLAVAWTPHGLIDLSKAKSIDEISPESGIWFHVDLAEAANARYDLDPFREDAPADSWAHFPRIDSGAHAAETSLFWFLPPGRPNVVTTCRHASPRAIRIPGLRCKRIHAVLSAGIAGGLPTSPIAVWDVLHESGEVERLPIGLNRDAWEYHPEKRGSSVERSSIYRGEPGDADVLVKSSYRISRQDDPVTSIGIVNADTRSDAGVTLLALTLERE